MSTTAVSSATQPAWVSMRQARNVTELQPYALMKLCLTGHLQWRCVPGDTLKFNRDDLARIAEGR